MAMARDTMIWVVDDDPELRKMVGTYLIDQTTDMNKPGGSPLSYQWVSVFSDSRNPHKNPHSFDQWGLWTKRGGVACSWLRAERGMGAVGFMPMRRWDSDISAGI